MKYIILRNRSTRPMYFGVYQRSDIEERNKPMWFYITTPLDALPVSFVSIEEARAVLSSLSSITSQNMGIVSMEEYEIMRVMVM